LPNAQQTSSALASLLRSAIVVDEWGPYDWRSPKLWPLDSVRSTPLRLAVLGPPGTWVVRYTRGIGALSKRKGRIPAIGRVDTIAVTPEAGSSGDWSLGLEHRADSGHVVRQFNYDQFEPSIRWVERIFRWTDESDPRVHPDRFAALLRGAPLLERTAPRLDVMWYRPSVASIPMTNWTLDATGEVNLPRGRYTVQTISDDAVRVWVDDQLVIDHWQPHESEVDEAPLGGGRHHLHVQYVQVEGWAELRVDIHRGPPTGSRGTPGPH
jgi:hypothetical protein